MGVPERALLQPCSNNPEVQLRVSICDMQPVEVKGKMHRNVTVIFMRPNQTVKYREYRGIHDQARARLAFTK